MTARKSNPLTAYQSKRHFDKTPEPSGRQRPASKAGKGLVFCVQKHLATQLHYDFRLEHNGVLLSWAVPKGPSLKASDRRLAMQVEDHPLDYADFEGVIPDGYGAGVVMLWDIGTWQPEGEDDVDDALAKGSLKFHLDGVKLKGSWALVRTKGPVRGAASDSGKSWLLIKHKDEWSGDIDVTTLAPLSVKSSLDLADLLASHDPDLWQSNRPGAKTGTHFEKIVEKAIAVQHANEQARQAGTSLPVPPAAKQRKGKRITKQ